MSDHITELQARNTELVEENRRLKTLLELMENAARKYHLERLELQFGLVSPAAMMVREFMDKYNQPRADKPTLSSEDTYHEQRKLRRTLLREEWQEYLEGEFDDDIIKLADSLADMVYVIYGTAETYGIPLDRVIAEVHRSNMTKTAAGDGKKVAKGEGYEPPKIKEVLEGQ